VLLTGHGISMSAHLANGPCRRAASAHRRCLGALASAVLIQTDSADMRHASSTEHALMRQRAMCAAMLPLAGRAAHARSNCSFAAALRRPGAHRAGRRAAGARPRRRRLARAARRPRRPPRPPSAAPGQHPPPPTPWRPARTPRAPRAAPPPAYPCPGLLRVQK